MLVNQQSVPSRPQLHVIPGIIQKKPSGQGRHKLFPPARDQQTIKQLVSNAIAGKVCNQNKNIFFSSVFIIDTFKTRTIWISYEGGYRPLIPRGVNPTRWDDSGNNSFFGVPFHSKTGNETKFILKQVKEVRERHWTRPEDANANRGNSKNETRNERGDEKHAQGASKHEDGSKNNGIDKSKTNGHNKPRPNKTRK
ncbi:hypothetical protein RFI_10778 [Reticulomyxa filosa]|uniref:Uncharacterized protein n=1 Tax=Reticulomyxa filosa TaxID=46433 RepID=X6NKV8_RETFI|nr:hypothetical protein RFI_10778 [Reticulomyxa filosa]|eukprot:ETO26359.1 hypothetical protein RFI_10778 [Reticulomyxa filosa]